MFVNWVEYYAKLHKIVTVAIPPQYTSQDCSECGHRVQKTLSTRTHECSECGTSLHRDHNAARNILVKGLEVLGVEKSTGGQPGTYTPDGENHLWLVEGNFGWLSGLVETGNFRGDSGESPSIIAAPVGRSNLERGGCQRVTIHAAEGSFSREATGSEKLENNAWGEAIAVAESQAFVRACARWGLGLYLHEESSII